MKRGFYFSTKKNTYFYNDINGVVSYVSDTISWNKKNKGNNIIYGKEEETNCYQETDIQQMYDAFGTRQLFLLITQECNLRCKYCVYSGEYTNQRVHGKNKMSEAVAKKAIDNYYEIYLENKKNNYLEKAIINFYGGEPLLEMDLIRTCVEYINSLFGENVMILMTTNGVLLTEDIISFLVQNNIYITVSLNGDKNENDRMRVTINEEGTFEKIINNLMLIRKYNKEYYEKNINLSGVYDYRTDLKKMEEFLENNNELPLYNKLTAVSSDFTNWYEQFKKEEKEKCFSQYNELRESFDKKTINGEFDKITKLEKIINKVEYGLIINRKQNIIDNNKIKFYTGMCIPGTKIAVDPSGNYHCCEKINLSRPIGSIEKGIDMVKITSALNDYKNLLEKQCSKCPIQNLCSVCFARCLDGNGNFTKENIKDCSKMIENYRERFTNLYNLYENGVNESLENSIRRG